ncbi:WD40 repeat domain-containing protein [Sphingobacterium sp. N143]|uniref:WD40 repeat domain-containing protein n=1 Tax=Sphingobacterium sp. N143 TaxID=2746727 RepID=UPI002578DFB0|nr:WD40 repeat domain-containing protein [Sphingobacterium sp. N143]MDM1295049.1 WD40 repeat domain-containing protein [Sphingobacterium sp. N143]
MMDIKLKATLQGHQNPIFCVEKGYYPNTFFTAGNDKGVVEWDVEKQAFKRILCAVSSSVYALRLIPDTAILAIGLREGKLLFVDVEQQKLVASLQLGTKAIFALAYMQWKNELLVVGEEGRLYVVDLDTYKSIYNIPVSPTTVRAIAVDEKLARIALGDKDGNIHILDSEDFHHMTSTKLHHMPTTSLAFLQGKLLSGGRDAQLIVSDVNRPDHNFSFVPHLFTVYGIYPHPSEPLFATVSRDKSLKFWSSDDFALLKNMSREKLKDGHHLSVNAGIWSDDGQYFFSVSDDKLVKVWEFKA